jgi:hypothetical protein
MKAKRRVTRRPISDVMRPQSFSSMKYLAFNLTRANCFNHKSGRNSCQHKEHIPARRTSHVTRHKSPPCRKRLGHEPATEAGRAHAHDMRLLQHTSHVTSHASRVISSHKARGCRSFEPKMANITTSLPHQDGNHGILCSGYCGTDLEQVGAKARERGRSLQLELGQTIHTSPGG